MSYVYIRMQVLSCLCTLAPLCVEDYMVCQGSTRLLLVLEWCSKTDDGEAYVHLNERCRRKEERSKQGQTNNKAKQHSTPKAVTFP